MNFFQPIIENPNASFETLEKQRLVWNKGLKYSLSQPRSDKGSKRSAEEKKMRSKSAKVRWANTVNRNRETHAVKLFQTPYGIMILKEAITISGLSEQSIRGRIGRGTNGWGKTDQYVIINLKGD